SLPLPPSPPPRRDGGGAGTAAAAGGPVAACGGRVVVGVLAGVVGATGLRPPAPRADGRAVLRVGRAVQPQEVWERLLPDGAARSTVSREHFELAGGPGERLLLAGTSAWAGRTSTACWCTARPWPRVP
ncbi:unnamed protein product, partial [Prorocentrum cordatum]